MKTYLSIVVPVLALLTLGSCRTKQQDGPIKCMTFNIRYDNRGDSLNSWETRRDTIAKFINSEHPDIFGLQEVLANQLHDLTACLTSYDYYGVGRDDGDEAGEYAPVFWDKERFAPVDKGVFWLSQYPDSAGFIGWDGACTRIATWVRLRDTETGDSLCLLNTHLDHVGAEAQVNGIDLILGRLEAIAGDGPVIMTGDFNVNATSEAYRHATSQPGLLVDSYTKAGRRDGVAYTYHDFDRIPESERQKIDYIFVSPTFEVTQTWIPGENTTGTLMSDHNPVITLLDYQNHTTTGHDQQSY